MSADGWRVCPRCLKAEIERREGMATDIAEAYGNVNPYEYTAMVTKFAQLEQLPEPFENESGTDWDTFREDEEFYIKDGVFHATYSGWCQNRGCSYGWDYHETMEVPKP